MKTSQNEKQSPGYKRWYLAALLLSIGVSLLAFSGLFGEQFVSPGKLTGAHARVENCNQCHSSLTQGFASLPGALASSETPIENSQLCLKCHQFDEPALSPHGLNETILQTLTEQSRQKETPEPSLDIQPTLMLAKSINEYGKDSQIPCSACHKEHLDGLSTADHLKGGTDQTCQSCHVQSFEHFDRGHPEFGQYPYQQVANFNFDHGQHFVKHFADDKYQSRAKQACNDCHISQNSAKVALRGFETSCANCHSKRIYGDKNDKNSVPFLAVPGLDLYTLMDAGINVGYWPEYAEAELTPFMALLLTGDPEYIVLKDTLDELDLMDLSDADEAQLQAVAKFAWMVKRLIYELAEKKGVFGMMAQFERVFERKLSNAERANLNAMMSSDSLRLSMFSWFAGLSEEMAAVDDGIFAETTMDADEQSWTEPDALTRVEGWYRNEYTLYYQLTGHGDQFVKAWLEATLNHPAGLSQPIESILDILSDKKSPGGCFKCHNISEPDIGPRQIRWTANIGEFDNKLTHFDHQPHMSIIGDKGCVGCHETEKEKDGQNFKALEKKTCTACHNENSVSQSCTTCHQYHGDSTTHPSQTKL